MALTPCRDCGAMVSDDARRCPQCGRTTDQASMRTARVVVLLVMLVGAILFAAFIWYGMNNL